MSTAMPRTAYPLTSPIAEFAYGASDEARSIWRAINTVKTHLMSSVSGQELNRIIYEIRRITQELSFHKWDGYDAVPINIGSSKLAIEFLEGMPRNSSMPEILPEPDGNVAFEWQRSRDYWLVLSFSSDGHIHYAGRYGDNRTKGTEKYMGNVPHEIFSKIFRLFRDGIDT